jgi:tRNA uridine 5-carboxymethylaminomethyl modification enzyme
MLLSKPGIETMSNDFDVIVIGGGHAGTEAAHAAAKMGCKTALLSLNPDRIGFMSCNPAMGGLAKGQLIKEIDALGGIMAINTDKTAIQYRRLNSSKGPAVRSSRAQCDKALYAAEMQKFLANVPNLSIVPLEATDILVENGRVSGVSLRDGSQIRGTAVVITSGTFLRAVMHTGFEQTSGGRLGDIAAMGLSGSLERLGFKLGRLKTGTPPRLHKDSIDYSQTEAQGGDEKPIPFSFYNIPNPVPFLRQVDCYITYTNQQTHEIIEENFESSPMFTGIIKGIGPRYCPSIEDKVKRFRERDRHQIFLEPEGLTTDELYVNGISTSLPKDVQERFVHSIKGLENAVFVKHGYAVEYDAIDARVLRSTLESKDVPGLFFAGQINGTSGYEEAGAQGLIAGIGAACFVKEADPFQISRLDGYIGVLVDDLITKGTDEPYRMFTSRAEYRLLLREDNADLRLGEMGHQLGLLGDREFKLLEKKKSEIKQWQSSLDNHFFVPSQTVVQDWLSLRGIPKLKDRVSAALFLRRAEVGWKDLCDLGFGGESADPVVQEQLEIQTKYEGYIKRDLELLEGVRKNENLKIPQALNFDEIPGLSTEIRGRLVQTRPETIGQASRLAGITPAAVANILIFMKMRGQRNKAPEGTALEHP